MANTLDCLASSVATLVSKLGLLASRLEKLVSTSVMLESKQDWLGNILATTASRMVMKGCNLARLASILD